MKMFLRRKVVVILLTIVVLQLVALPMAASAAPAASGGFWHTVRWGETLFSIGRLYGVNPWAIAHANYLPNPNYIWAGQSLWIPAAPWSPGPPGPGYCRYWYTVKYGDNLTRIASWYGTSAWAIAQTNRIYNLNRIYAGTTLCIP
jgi:LysM repeat protein